MAPGVNGRQTGTVPKTKPHNDSSRDVVWQSRREQSYNNIPNNLVSILVVIFQHFQFRTE